MTVSKPTLVLRSVVLAVLVWQAGAAATMLARHSWANADVAWSTRLLASTDERLRMMLGPDAETLFALRLAAEPGAIWVLQKVVGRIEDVKSVAEFERLAARNGLNIMLATLSYPVPWLLEVPEPFATVETEAAKGLTLRLCVLPGDLEPAARPGWLCEKTTTHFKLWHFQKP